jgi:putative endonuclease
MRDKTFAVYIMASDRNGTLYIGVTSGLVGRVRQHKAKALKGFTSRYGVDKLVYREFYDSAEAAFDREKELKKWRRAWKVQLIESENPLWEDIARLWDHPEYREDWDGIFPPKASGSER